MTGVWVEALIPTAAALYAALRVERSRTGRDTPTPYTPRHRHT